METNNNNNNTKVPSVRDALAELVACIEIRAKAFDIFSIIDTKTFLDAKAALEQPRKNSEVGTPEEQEIRFDEFCRKYAGDDVVCNSECPLFRHLGHSCALAWGQMPYTESEVK